MVLGPDQTIFSLKHANMQISKDIERFKSQLLTKVS